MNLIYQYMITNEETEKRKKVPEYPQGTRSELYRKTADLSAESFRIYADKLDCVHHIRWFGQRYSLRYYK